VSGGEFLATPAAPPEGQLPGSPPATARNDLPCFGLALRPKQALGGTISAAAMPGAGQPFAEASPMRGIDIGRQFVSPQFGRKKRIGRQAHGHKLEGRE